MTVWRLGCIEPPAGMPGTAAPKSACSSRVAGSPVSVQGPPGFALFAVGLDDGPAVFLPPYGSLLCGNTLAMFASAPVGAPVPYPIAGGAWLIGRRRGLVHERRPPAHLALTAARCVSRATTRIRG